MVFIWGVNYSIITDCLRGNIWGSYGVSIKVSLLIVYEKIKGVPMGVLIKVAVLIFYEKIKGVHRGV